MSKSMKWVSFAIATLLAVPASLAFGQDTKPAPPPPPEEKAPPPEDKPAKVDAPDGAAAELKAGTGIDKKKREVVGEAESFSAGTRVWVWSSITGAKGTTVKHVWKKGDKVIWEKEFSAKSNRYRTWTRRNVKAGEYTVEVQTEDGAVLGTITITVT